MKLINLEWLEIDQYFWILNLVFGSVGKHDFIWLMRLENWIDFGEKSNCGFEIAFEKCRLYNASGNLVFSHWNKWGTQVLSQYDLATVATWLGHSSDLTHLDFVKVSGCICEMSACMHHRLHVHSCFTLFNSINNFYKHSHGYMSTSRWKCRTSPTPFLM